MSKKKTTDTSLWMIFKANQEKYERLNELYNKLEYCEDSLEGWIVDKPVRMDNLTAEINGEDVNIISLIQSAKNRIYQEMMRRQQENVSISKKIKY